MKNKLIKAIKQWNDACESDYKKFIFAEDLKDKHRNKILEGFGKHVPYEEWLAVYDDTLTKNGKKGIIFTDDKLYLNGVEPILLENIAAAYKMSVLHYYLEMKDRTYAYYKYDCLIGEVLPILQNLTGIIQAQNRPTQGYEALHTTYRRELRRRMNEVMKAFCEKSNQFVSVELASEEFVENALLSWPDIDKTRIIGFLKTVKDNGKESIVITEEAIYAGTDKPVEVTFDGLKKVIIGDSIDRHVLYENHYAERCRLWMSETDQPMFQELLDSYISIYQDLMQEIKSGNVTRSGLDLSEGLNAFFEKKDDALVDTYKNTIFVSSTFRDMHFERDIIHEKVQPALSALADTYGESISFCDLRWGVNTEDLDSEEGAKKVLVVCMDEIEKCNPYMLIMLGERYGWIPNERTIKNALENRPDFVLEELENSVTALEIEFGALSKKTDKERIFIYFREMDHVPSNDYKSEDDYHAQKLAKLKERVRKLAPDRVKTYHLSWDEKLQTMKGVDIFAQMVIDDIGRSMELVWRQKEQLSPFDQEVKQHISYMNQKAELCYGRRGLLEQCLQTLEDGAHLLALTGVSGCGKSTVMSALAASLIESDVRVLPIFCGHTARTETALGLIGHMVYFMENLLGMPHYEEGQPDISEEMWMTRMKSMIECYSKESDRPLIFIIDAIDQLAADHIRNSLKFIPDNVDVLGSKVYMVISCLDDFELAAFPFKLQVQMLASESKPLAIRGILKKNRRELDDVVIQNIMKKAASDSPLYLTLLIQRLLMMNKNDFDDIMADGDGMPAITKHQKEIVAGCGENISDICGEMIRVAAERIGGAFVKKAIDFIVISGHGLRESDLEGLLRNSGISWNRLEFSLFINYLRNVFVLREDGCYDFSHKIFRQELMEETAQRRELHKQLFQWLEQLPEHDFLRERELLDHCIEAGDTEGFIRNVAAWMEGNKDTKDLNKKFLEFCRADQGQWLIEMIRYIKEETFSGSEVNLFLKYVTEEIGRAFDSSPEDLKIRKTLYTEMLPVAEYLAESRGSLDDWRRVMVIVSRLGVVHQAYKEYDVAETYYKKALHLSETRIKADVDISVDYRVLANLYTKYEDDQHDALAVACYQKSIELGEKALEQEQTVYARRMLGVTYDRFGDYCRSKNQEELAVKYYLKCREIWVALVQEQFSIREAKNLSYVLESLGDCYREKDKALAAKYYDELVECREKIVQTERTLSHMTQLAWACNDAGYAYLSSEKEENQPLALDRYEKCIPIFEEVLKTQKNMDMLWHLADDYRFCMKILGVKRDVDSQKKMQKYAYRAFELYEYRAKELNTEDAYNCFYDALQIYSDMMEDQSEKCKSIEKQIEILNLLYEMTNEKSYKKIAKIKKVSLKLYQVTKKL